MDERTLVSIEETVAFIEEQCVRYYATFQSFSHVAKFQFQSRLWQAQRNTNTSRLDLIGRNVQTCKEKIIHSISANDEGSQIWARIKELAREGTSKVPFPILESFLYSIEQSLYPTIMATMDGFEVRLPESKVSEELVHIRGNYPFRELCASIIDTPGFTSLHEDHTRDVDLLCLNLEKMVNPGEINVILFPRLFYRNQHAYLVGIIEQDNDPIPLTIAFINTERGIKTDAVFFTEPEIIRIFEFTRSYFLVDTQDPEGLIIFLLKVMPHKRAEQLIINLGYQEWGKLLIRCNFNKHLQSSGQKLAYAPGIKGMVMLVFALPDYPMVFKAIKNDIPPPKTTTREKVVERYHLVSRHDRVGRLADAQLFKHWAFPLTAFDPSLLSDLEASVGSFLEITAHEVIFTQLFTERKMTPLNIFLDSASTEEAKKVVLDYGNAIKEMAMSNVFPGDLLLKNFGVTHDLRVVFYDYDEVTLLTNCTFRKLPEPRYEEEIWDDETWTVVHENDIFPEELEKFMLPEGPYRQLFREHHGDIFDIYFWNRWKGFHQNNGFIDLQPY